MINTENEVSYGKLVTYMNDGTSITSVRQIRRTEILWDLSAAFDNLDVDIFCEKIIIYGFQPKTVKWFRSFLTGRAQRVKIDNLFGCTCEAS